MAIFAAAFFAKHSIETALLEEAFARQQDLVLKSAARYLRSEDFKTPAAPHAQRQLRSFVQDLNSREVARVAVWSRDQRIIFSDLPSVIGKRFPERSDLTKLFKKESQPFFEQRDQDSQSSVLAETKNFLDVFVPIQFGGVTVGAVEVYVDSHAVLEPVRRQIQLPIVTLALSGVLILLVLVLFRKSLLRANHERRRREQIQKLVGELVQEIAQLDLNALIKKLEEKVRVVLDVDVAEVKFGKKNN